MTQAAFAKKMAEIGVEYDGRVAMMSDYNTLKRFFGFCRRKRLSATKIGMREYYVNEDQFNANIVLSVFNKTTGVIKSRKCDRYPKKDAVYNMIEDIREYEHDTILVEINPNVEDFDDYIPFND